MIASGFSSRTRVAGEVHPTEPLHCYHLPGAQSIDCRSKRIGAAHFAPVLSHVG